MRRAVLAPILLVAIMLPVLGALASAEQPLAADIQRGVVVLDTTITLYKRGTAPSQLCQPILIGRDDVQRILGWGTDTVYAVIYVTGLDPYAGVAPQLTLSITTMSTSLGNTMWLSPSIAVQKQGVYEIPVPVDKIRRAAEATGSVKLVICIPNWNTDTANGAPDNYYAVVIDKIVLAPPQGAIHDKPQATPVTVRPESAGLGSSRALLLGAGAVAVAIIVAVFVARR